MSRHLTKQLLLSGSFWVLNKNLVQVLGLETAFLLSNFTEAEKMMADQEGWFYQTTPTVEKMTTLSRHKQDQCIKQLIDLDVLEQKNKGMPMKRYFRINFDRVATLLVDNLQPSEKEIDNQVCEKSATSKESSYKESDNKESSSGSDNNLYSKSTETLIRLFESSGFGQLNYYVGEQLGALEEEFTAEWVEDAMKEAIDNNVRKLSYVTAILRDWKAKGKNFRSESKNNKRVVLAGLIDYESPLGEREEEW